MSDKSTFLTLYRGWPESQSQYVWSPFVTKLEARLRFAGVCYSTAAGSPRTAPKGKIPYVEFPAPKGAADSPVQQMGDSTLITSHFVKMGLVPDLNGPLSMEDRARDLATRALLEDKLYFFDVSFHCIISRITINTRTDLKFKIRERWIDNYYTMRDYALSAIPWPLRVFTGQLVYRKTETLLQAQGNLRLSEEEVSFVKNEIWQSIAEVLLAVRSSSNPSRNAKGSKASSELFWFLGGNRPTEADATLFGFIVSALFCKA